MSSTSEASSPISFKVAKDDLAEALGSATRIASSRTSIQALAGVQISASGEGIELRATDMELALRLPLEGEVIKEGEVVLPGRLFADVVRSLPAGDLELTARNATQDVEVKSGPSTFTIRTLRTEDFPTLPRGDGKDSVQIPAGVLGETVRRVERASSSDQSRPVLTGILVQAEGDVLRMVATDSYRLAVKETTLAQSLSGSFEANVPARALQEAVRLSTDGDESLVGISVEENQIVFSVGGSVLASRLIDGQFPKYADLIPESFEHELKLDAGEVLDVIRRVSLMAQGSKPLTLSFLKGELTVRAETQDVGEAHESVPVPFEGESLEIGFNPVFLRDGFESAGEGGITFKLISSVRPGLISDGDGFEYLIMPMRLGT